MASFTVSRHFAEEGDEENTRRRFAELTELGWPEHYGARFFGEREAAVYDDLAADMSDPAVVTPVVDTLAELAGEGRALEFGIGTGRIALPLAERGVRVHGIDASEAMVARLRAKAGGKEIDVTIGDFATASVDGRFSLVYLVFNTIFNLITQDEQVACFQNAAEHLDAGGCFVVELGVPELQRLPPGQNISMIGVDAREMSFDVYDVVTQRLTSHHFVISEEKINSYPVEGRYAWPSELDLMARLAGLSLRETLGWLEAGAIHERQSLARVHLREVLDCARTSRVAATRF